MFRSRLCKIAWITSWPAKTYRLDRAPSKHEAHVIGVAACTYFPDRPAVVGPFHGRSIAASLDDLADRRLEEALARSLITLLVLISYFAFRVLGDGRRTLFVARGLGA
jgi:hypothetical protein